MTGQDRLKALADLRALLETSPDGGRRNRWMTDTALEATMAILEVHRAPDAVTDGEALALMATLPVIDGDATTRKMLVGGTEVTLRVREVHMDGRTRYSSPRVAGLHERGEVPVEPGSSKQVREMMEERFREMGHRSSPIISVERSDRNRMYTGFAIEMVTFERPEGGGRYAEAINFEHLPDRERKANILRACAAVAMRWKARKDIAREISDRTARIAPMIDGVDGMELEEVRLGYIGYEDGKTKRINLTAHISMIGRTFERTVICVAADDETALRKRVGEHVRAREKMGTQRPDDVRTCEPVLAKAIRAQAAVHGAGLLDEIRKIIDGRSPQPLNPRKRGISNMSMRKGRLSGKVMLAKNVAMMKDRLNAKEIRQLPDSVKIAMVGMPITRIIDHPHLEGLIVQSLTINSIGLNIRPVAADVPLAEVIEDLEATVRTGKGSKT